MRVVKLMAYPVLLLAPFTGLAQAPPHLDGHRLPLQTDTFAVYVIRGNDTAQTGVLIDRLVSDGQVLTRLYAQEDAVLGPQDDSIVSRIADLRPIAYHSRTDRHIAHLQFRGKRVDGWMRLPNDDSVAVDVQLPGLVYDGSSYDLVVRASDLREGFQLTVPAFLEGSNTVGSIDGHVAGSEVVDGADCWVFEAHFAGMPVTFWIDKETRALRRQLMQISVTIGVLFTAPPRQRANLRATQ